jgi:outer membrane usher protein
MPARSTPRSTSSLSGLAIGALIMLAATGPVSAQPTSSERVPPGAAPPAVLPTAAAADEELLLQVNVNAQGLADPVLVLRSPDGKIAVPVDSLDRWRLRRPAVSPRFHAGTPYYALDAISGVSYVYDAAKQRLTVTAPPDAFTSSQFVNAQAPYPSPTVSQLGAFLNYNLFASHATGSSLYAGQFEGGVFSPYGVLISSMLAQDTDSTKKAIRLDTTWTTDFPQKLSTLRIGDATSVPGAWGRAVRFGGVQYSTNFATQPGYITFPSIASSGQAALPSTVDVFVNNALVAQKTVPPGPFSITNIPTVNGSGNVQLVVRDLFGREQVISQPFYASVNLLKAGLEDFSYEAGVERNNFGTDSGDYGHAVASATYRRGLTDRLTGEVRGEASRNLGVAGVAAGYLIDDIGVASATAAASGGSDGSGVLGGAGFQRQTGRLSIFAQALWSSSSFRQIGATPENPVPLRQLTASVGYQMDRFGSANVTYVAQDFRTKENVHIASAGYSVAIGPWAFLGLTASKVFGEHGSVQFGATLTVPLGERTIAATGYNATRRSAQSNSSDTSVTLQRSVPFGEGYGYRVVAHTLNNQLEADGIWQNNYGTYEVDLTRFQGSTAGRVSVAGGLGYVGGHAFASRQITDSFAVVRVADYAGVGILQDNQPAGRTDAGGFAVLPQLRAFDINRVSIEERDLPLDAQVDKLKMEAVPFFRSGLLVDFPVRRSHGATLHIRLDDGGPIPSGAIVRVAGRDEEFPVALDGEAYVTGLEDHNRLRATWKGRSCELEVDFPHTTDPLPDLGAFVCHGVAR